MKKLVILAIVVALIIAFALPGSLFAADPGHQRVASNLRGDVTTEVPQHIVGEDFGNGHQSGMALIKDGSASFVFDHLLGWE